MIQGKSGNARIADGASQIRGAEFIAYRVGRPPSCEEIIVGVIPSFYNAGYLVCCVVYKAGKDLKRRTARWNH